MRRTNLPILIALALFLTPSIALAQTYFSNNTALGIDGGGNSTKDADIVVTGITNPLTDVDVVVNFEKIGSTVTTSDPNACPALGGAGHVTGQSPLNTQISLQLIAPDGTTVNLVNAGQYATAATYGGLVGVWFDDSAAAVVSGSPVAGTFKPATGSNLATLNGKSGAAVNGTWKVRLGDSAAGDPLCYYSATLALNTGTAPTATSVSISDATITEGDAGTKALNFTVTRTNTTSPAYFEYSTSVIGGTATNTTDFIPVTSPQSITLAPGQGNTTISITLNGDNTVEANETFFVNLSAPGKNVTLSDAQALGTITNDDSAVVSITNNTASSVEGSPIGFTVSLSKPVDRIVTLNYATANGTAASATDYTAIAATAISFPAGSTTGIPLTVNTLETKDASLRSIVELNETLQVNLTALSTGAGANIRDVTFTGAAASIGATGTIADDDTSVISFAAAPSVAEGTALTFTLNLSLPVDSAIVFSRTTQDGTALTANTDYTALAAANQTVNAGAVSATVVVATINDTIVETDENLSVVLSSLNAAGRAVTFTAAAPTLAQTGTITNNDTSTISIAAVTAAEGATGNSALNFAVNLTAAVDTPITIQYSTGLGATNPATSGTDFIAAAGQLLTIPANTLTVNAVVNAIGDNIVEANETFTTTISNLNNSGRAGVALGAVAALTAIGTITNDDAAVLSITTTSIPEGGTNGVDTAVGSLAYNITLSNPVDVPVTFTRVTANGATNPATAGTDYTAIASGQVTIPANTTTIPAITVNTIEDGITEADETVNLNLSLLTSTPARNVTFSSGTATLSATANIQNDDNAFIDISLLSATTATEGAAGGMTFIVTLSNPVDTIVTVTDTLTSGTATATTDYGVATPAAISFPANAAGSITVQIPTVADNIVELDETVNFALTAITAGTVGSRPGVKFQGNAASITREGLIVNDDIAYVDLSTPTAANEGTAIAFNVTLSKAIDVPLTLNRVTTDGTAVSPGDYTGFATTQTTIAANATTAAISIPTINDTTVEQTTEAFTLAISTLAASGRDVRFIGEATNLTRTGNIADNDTATVSIAAANINEGNAGTGTLNLAVTLSAPVDSAISVQYSTSAGATNPATAGTDFTAVAAQVINIPANTTTINAPVVITGDTTVELNETFNATINNLVNNGRGVTLGTATAIGTITNDDTATITVTSNQVPNTSFTFAEGSTLVYTIAISNPVDTAISFSKALVAGVTNPATIGTDLASADGAGTITFAANSTTPATVTVTTTDDTTTEANENFFFRLGASTNTGTLRNVVHSGGTNVQTDYTSTITDNDTSVISIAKKAATSEAEGNTGANTNLTFTITLSKPLDSTITFTRASSSGTAVKGTDFTDAGATVTFIANQTSQDFVIPTIGEALVEDNENFNVTLSALNTGGKNVAFNGGGATLNLLGNILNDDNSTINIGSVTANEGNTGTSNLAFPITLTNPVDTAVTLQLTTTNGTATAGVDYTAINIGTVTIPANTTNMTTPVVITGDNVVEAGETLTAGVLLQNNGGRTTVTLGTNTATGTINNDDTTVVSILAAGANEGNAGNTNLNLAVNLTNPVDVPISVQYSTSAGTTNPATAGTDYTAVVGQVINIPANTTTVNAPVVLTGDTTVELNETFNATISTLNNGGRTGVALGAAGVLTAVGTITNDDTATVLVTSNQVPNTSFIVNEGSPLVYTIALSNPVDVAVSVTKALVAGTATLTTDYASADGTGTITFPANTTTPATITVTTAGDTITESTETFLLRLGAVTGVAGRAVVHSGGTNVQTDYTSTITDNDTSVVTIARTANTSEIEGAALSFTVTLSNPVSTAVSITRASTDATASKTDSDYTDAGGTITFAANETSKVFTIQSTVDTKVEEHETFNIVLSALNPNGSNVTFNGGGATLNLVANILNDDNATVSIGSVTANEGNTGTTNLAFPITLTNPVDTAVTLQLTTTNGTATAGTDYTAVNIGTVTVPANSTNTTAIIAVAGDTLVEASETLTAAVVLQNAGRPSVALGTNTATGTITNDDTATISIVAANTNEGNAGTATLNLAINLTNPIDVPTSIQYATSAGVTNPATAGTDYTAVVAQVINIPANTTTLNAPIVIAGDTTVELDETITTTISNLNNGGRTGATLGTTSAVVTITNDDNATVIVTSNQVPNTSFVVNEGNPLVYTLTLSNPVDTAVSFTKALVAGTATLTTDYASADGTGTITFPANSTTPATITVTTVNDGLTETNETFLLRLGALTNAGRAVVHSSGNTAQIDYNSSITDSDASVISIVRTAATSETEGAALSFTVTLSNPVNGAISLTRASTSNTASTTDSDYTDAGGTITFAANETSKVFTIQSTTDNKVENNENFNVVLSALNTGGKNVTFNGGGATLTLIANILNDDNATLSIGNVAITEGNAGTSNLSFPLTLSNPVDTAITTQLTTSNGTATAGADYTALNASTITIPANTTASNAVVTVAGENLVELNEALTATIASLNASGRNVTLGTTAGTGTINNDDAAVVSISSPSVTEGGVLAFNVALSNPVDAPITLTRITEDGTATLANSDYTQLAAANLTLPANSNTPVVVNVQTTDDPNAETNETLKLTGSALGVSGRSVTFTGSVPSLSGTGTILDDDSGLKATLSIGATSISEFGGSTQVTATLNGNATSNVTVNLGFTGPATFNSDYGINNSIVIPIGSSTASVTISSLNDNVLEGSEVATISITSVTNANENGEQQVALTITDDEVNADSDGDGISNALECPNPQSCTDSDKDTIPNYQDKDSDNDGISDTTEGLVSPGVLADTDSDSIPDYADLDSDKDGIVDVLESQSTVSLKKPDGTDINANGIDDAFDAAFGKSFTTPVDTDGDNTPDYRDLDSDNDGFTDNREVYDTNFDGTVDTLPSNLDTDGDGIDNSYDLYDNTVVNWPLNVRSFNTDLKDTDGDTDPDFRDSESSSTCSAISTENAKFQLTQAANNQFSRYSQADKVNNKRSRARECSRTSAKLRNRLSTEVDNAKAQITLLVNSIPGNHFVCEAPLPNCSAFNIANIKAQLEVHARKLQTNARAALGKCNKTKAGKNAISNINRDYNSSRAAANVLPDPFLNCQ